MLNNENIALIETYFNTVVLTRAQLNEKTEDTIIPMTQLLENPEKLRELATWYQHAHQFKSLASASSQVSKYLARHSCAVFFMVSVLRMTEPFHPASWYIRWDQQYHYPQLLVVKPESPALSEPGEAQPRSGEQTLQELFQYWLIPLVERISAMTRLKTDLLWENIFVYIRFYYLRFLESCKSDVSMYAMIEKEYTWITMTSPAPWHPANIANPFAGLHETIPHPVNEAETFLVRQTCCLRDQGNDGKKCSSCPLLQPEERYQQLEQLAK
ncbi:(2Fe-2S)-binding protein [Marinicrinis sediminis]|uniref:(2Fe-2S)-binding protein n=1 Tax=Marinicrinis sediminis TaxID=1652465 RepID=A0ABW5RCQ2_9BACL